MIVEPDLDEIMDTVEAFSSESWMTGTYSGRADGLKQAREALLERAGTLFAQGKDDEARMIRAAAADINKLYDVAEQAAQTRRQETE